jgi:hypothetical protein
MGFGYSRGVVSQRLLSQLAHVELLTPRPQESLEFARAPRGAGEENPFAMVSVS